MMTKEKILTKVLFQPTGLTVAVHHENCSLCTHGTVVGHGSEDHSGRSYKIIVIKTGCIITRNQGTCEEHLYPSRRLPA